MNWFNSQPHGFEYVTIKQINITTTSIARSSDTLNRCHTLLFLMESGAQFQRYWVLYRIKLYQNWFNNQIKNESLIIHSVKGRKFPKINAQYFIKFPAEFNRFNHFFPVFNQQKMIYYMAPNNGKQKLRIPYYTFPENRQINSIDLEQHRIKFWLIPHNHLQI